MLALPIEFNVLQGILSSGPTGLIGNMLGVFVHTTPFKNIHIDLDQGIQHFALSVHHNLDALLYVGGPVFSLGFSVFRF